MHVFIYIYMFMGCIALAMNKLTMKQNKVRHSTLIKSVLVTSCVSPFFTS